VEQGIAHQPSVFADASAAPRLGLGFEWRPLTDEYLVVLEQRHEELGDAHLRVRGKGRIRVGVRDGLRVRVRVRVRNGVGVRARNGVGVRVRNGVGG
tara:strand:+ start:486 stop:776 length:291 start_codon:yes stop_codon:yes gene_type:complete